MNFFYRVLKKNKFSENLAHLFFLLSGHKFSSIAFVRVANFNEEKRKKKTLKIGKVICLEYIICMFACLFFSKLGYAQKHEPIAQYENRIQKLNKYNKIKFTDDVRILNRISRISKRKSLSKTMFLAQFYFPLFEIKLKEYGLPPELKYLPVVESDLKTVAKSDAGAQGLWQFMYTTGKAYGLKKNRVINTFNDPIASTDAACRYLKYLYKELGNWELALAAYNCGIGRVKKILKRTGKKTFWEIIDHLPKETQNYVPSFLAVNYLMYYHRAYNVKPKKFPINYSQLMLKIANKTLHRSSLGLSSNLQKTIFSFINPHLRTSIIPKGAYYYVLK